MLNLEHHRSAERTNAGFCGVLMLLFIPESYYYTALQQVSECCVNSNHSSFCLYCPGTIAISGILAYNKASGYGGRCMGVRIISLIIMGLSLVFLLVTLCNRTYRKYYLPIKMVCSLEFMLLSFIMGLLSGQLLQTLKLLPGLLLCLIGDLFTGNDGICNGSYLFPCDAVCFTSIPVGRSYGCDCYADRH